MLKNIKRSLRGLLGEDYCRAACAARAALVGGDCQALWRLACEEVAFYPAAFARRQEALMAQMGQAIAPGAPRLPDGAPTRAFGRAQQGAAAPLSALGCFRVGEDGRLYFAAKAEHYHIPLGHGFPGYRLLALAQRLGIPNAAHNSARGYITRLCERRLVAEAAGLGAADGAAVDALLASESQGDLNRVINLETGSLAVEAALKMMLGRFYAIEGGGAPCAGRVPVFLVMADSEGGATAGYHGTTLLAQTLRGLWPQLAEKAGESGLYRVAPVPINDAAAFERIIAECNRPPYRTAGFCHEIVMMNYGAALLEQGFLQRAYAACRRYGTPVLCDEIQSCGWYGGVFLFKRYGLRPDFLAMGKGLPGGNYPASRILCSAEYDNLIQFGALVTNGQEELASLSYLVTMEFLEANGAAIDENGRYFHGLMQRVAARHPALCCGVSGDAHMSALRFGSAQGAADFCERMRQGWAVDISAQAYKPSCPPAALAKLPVIATPAMMDALAAAMDGCLAAAERGAGGEAGWANG
ncbi:MAG: aminotransferase class III-fold pyridoxal phosphate-dependent enzyme [Clostridiales bacterium]|jgi:acetylornithine/succinyldiaminopimelate/putrescine aminotransferase|nr:aminotransferase class III-fold pyridoxal phosphate-dependent enzyme [Clostridiales bacterium]